MSVVDEHKEAGLIVENVHFSFGDHAMLLNGINMFLRPGEQLALLGVNGSGKTSLLRVLTGFLKRRSGVIRWDGVDIDAISTAQLARRVALVDMEGGPLFSMEVRELLLLGRSPHTGIWGRFTPEDECMVMEAATCMNLLPLLDRLWQELSRGEQQRVRLAMALSSKPAFLLLDEPTSHLDPSYQRELLRLCRDLALNRGIGVMAVLHDVNLARHFDRLLLLHEGRILFDGPPAEVLEQSRLDKIYGTGVFSMHSWEGLPVGTLNVAPNPDL
ncbi:MAG: ABC transporter ATP-binding protein [Candidatus Riflebacteria bacterium]|nr:ABC transporter ATP-binding protein [Candidatus Riflebacteria bacterium]